MRVRRAVGILAVLMLFAQFGCATTEWNLPQPWVEYPPPGGWKGEGIYRDGYWWMPSLVGLYPEYGNRGVIFYAGKEEIAQPPLPGVVEKVVYKPIPRREEIPATRYICPVFTFPECSTKLPPGILYCHPNGELTKPPSCLWQVAELIKKSGSGRIFVEGHMDSSEKARCPNISRERAEKVRTALVESGVNPNILEIKDLGDTVPVSTSGTAAGRELNRGVSFTIVPRGARLKPETLSQPPAPEVPPGARVVERVIEKEVTVPELVITDKIIFPNVYFRTGKSNLTKMGLNTTDRVAEAIENINGINAVTAEGYSDSRGKPAANQRLSDQRAESVKEELVHKGVKPSMVQAVGNGTINPLGPNDTGLGRALNRRVEIKVK
jgi:outer membrane protein OmpA-like peptidoglycan-associated protein